MKAVSRVGVIPSDRSPWDVLALSYGLRYVVRDMGNGVRRILSAQLMPIDDARSQAVMPGRLEVPFPAPVWMVDLGYAAVESLGIPVDRNNRARTPMIYASDVDDYTIELVCWRA